MINNRKKRHVRLLWRHQNPKHESLKLCFAGGYQLAGAYVIPRLSRVQNPLPFRCSSWLRTRFSVHERWSSRIWTNKSIYIYTHTYRVVLNSNKPPMKPPTLIYQLCIYVNVIYIYREREIPWYPNSIATMLKFPMVVFPFRYWICPALYYVYIYIYIYYNSKKTNNIQQW